MAEHFHLAAAWDWEYDADFIHMLERHIHNRYMLFYSITHHNTHETLRRLQRRELSFGVLLDRAADTDENFSPLIRWARRSTIELIHPLRLLRRAADKAVMHSAFDANGIDVPFTLIISPFAHKKPISLSLGDLARLGRPFIIKPAVTTGGGSGVITGAESLKDILESRQHHTNDRYLLQERIVPRLLEGRRAWFRVFWAFGQVIPCWWDDQTHVYGLLARREMERLGLRQLITITRRIHDVCLLEFFSTEIAVTEAGRYPVIDYVNEICDMRLQSCHPDGVPDEVVATICSRLARHVRTVHATPPSGTPGGSGRIVA